MEGYFLHTPAACGGERLNPLSRGAAVRDVRLPQLSALSLDELRRWLEKLEQELPSAHQKTGGAVFAGSADKASALVGRWFGISFAGAAGGNTFRR